MACQCRSVSCKPHNGSSNLILLFIRKRLYEAQSVSAFCARNPDVRPKAVLCSGLQVRTPFALLMEYSLSRQHFGTGRSPG